MPKRLFCQTAGGYGQKTLSKDTAARSLLKENYIGGNYEA